ncbi:putative nonribosomal peptide synthase [Talaromyces proteolyticus]|uniref:Nonribosomal peptide synthase n=1 Tax=Talaromyces proteolyticus TaxID=1131652 RepID=A0AAD4KM79_9EURO|nr:putative nonribosomal peptide synthase [Talaromyces proteolyticus]KAH8691335.1 putative nonribosomal peptide synthase [Talaromyces proteolyticus]
MPQTRLQFQIGVSASEIAIAWTILLKDYVGSSNVLFYVTDSTLLFLPSKRTKSITLEIDERETLNQLSKKLEEQTLPGSDDIGNSQSSPFQTHLYISDVEAISAANDQTNFIELTESIETTDILPSNLKVDFTLKCLILEDGQGINVSAVPSSPACSSTQALRILQQLEHVIHQIHQPEQQRNKLVYEINTASDSDLRDVWTWNSTEPVGEENTALEVFTNIVKHYPSSPAINAWDGELSYKELDELSTIFSSHLTHAGIGSGNIVPLCFEKSVWTPVAIWSVIKTGAAFVLLDENLPEDRLRQVAQIIGPNGFLALASSSQKHRAKLITSQVIVVDSEYLESVDIPSKRKVDPRIQSSDLIYIVFTSGSTGVPKAAMLSHNNICVFSSSIGVLSNVAHESRILALASYAYDVSLGNIFLSLLNGACLCIPSSWECKNDVGRVVQNYRITHAMMTPSVSKMLHASDSRTLEVLDLCGEPCSEDALEKWRGTRTRVMNTYGPAECTVTTVANPNVLLSSKPTVIGKGVGVCWVMDPIDRDRLTPIGAVGELVLEGPMVGLGYLHDEKTTRSKFLNNPEWLQNGHLGVTTGRRGRLYRTGDLVRYTDDGLIDYVGRRDMQVKIRGQRVELGEVSAHLQQHMPSSIEWCPEVVRLEGGAELLVVFLAIPDVAFANRLENDKVDDLRVIIDQVSFELRRKLPPALVPGAYTRIDQIPLALTGKIDHRKLKQIALSLTTDRLIFPQTKPMDACLNSKRQTGNSRPTTDGNRHTNGSSIKRQNGNDNNGISKDLKFKLLKQIWSDILHVEIESIHPTDSFFAHGGESLAAIRFVSAATRNGIQLDVSTIFRHPQFEDLASNSKLSHTSLPKPPVRFALIREEKVVDEIALSCGISTDNIEDVYPCTPLQEGLITAESSKSASYVGRGRFALPQHTNLTLFARAWQRVAETHPILRTRIVDTDSHGLLQVVLRDGSLFAGIQTGNLASYLKGDMRRKMGLNTELCRWGIVRERQIAYFVLTMHHSIYDGWTLPRIVSDAFRAYQGIRIEPSIGFNVFIDHIRSLPLKPTEDFWARQLKDPERTSVFPALPPGIREPLADRTVSKTFATPSNANKGISIPSLLRAAWALLVSRILGVDDVTFGATVSGRNVAINGIEDLLSPTISTIPVRVRIDESTNVENFIAGVQNDALEAMPFENFGLQNIRKVNEDTRQGSKFQTLFIVHPPDASNLESLSTSSPVEQELKTMLEKLDISDTLSSFNEYSLMVLITQAKGHLRVEANYDSRVLGTNQITLLLEQFAHVAVQIGSRNNMRLSLREIPIASEIDIEKIWQWNATPFSPTSECIQDVVRRTSQLRPQAEAIVAWDGTASFDDVDKLSLRLSHILRAKGVRRGSLVPICMEKSMWATIAMLGILKSGAGFVPMDVRHQPKQRLLSIVEQAGATCIVTAGPATALASELCKEVIACDQLLNSASYDADGLFVDSEQSSPLDTAFIVFTSGSTGVPKGIVITHENFCSTIRHHSRELKLSNNSRIYDYASYSFDIAVHNSLMALCLGGCLCIPSEDDRENDIEGSFERLKANWADLTPSVVRLIDPSAVPGLKTLVLSGEAVGKDIVRLWATKVDLINAYGPAECQICTVQGNVKTPEQTPAIGRAVGCHAWIVEPQSNNLSAIGAIGELVIEGPIVSPGYLNASNTSFIRDPPWLVAGSKAVPGRRGLLYRTGDLVQYQIDGTILYVGRAATQVKINGQRVELNEVEFHVKQAVPTLSEVVAEVIDFGGTNTLTAFMVDSNNSQTGKRLRGLHNDDSPTIDLASPPTELQSRLKTVLPPYMVPTVYLNTSHIPLTPTRKIDRQKLKRYASHIAKDGLLQWTQKEQVDTLTIFNQRQLTMATIWSRVLKVETSKIGLHSDFFRLGGDSISAMRLVKYARKERLVLTVADIFLHSQFDQLSNIAHEIVDINDDLEDSADRIQPFDLIPVSGRDVLLSSAATICRVPQDAIIDIYPCTPFQEAVFALTARNSSAYVQHTQLRFSDNLSLDRVLGAWNKVIEANAILRTRLIQSEEAKLLQVVIHHERNIWNWYNTSQEYLDEAAKTPMGLGHSLFRFGIVRNGSASAAGYNLIWTMHHAIYDAWSMDLILRQVSKYYYSQELPSANPDYNIFVDFLRRQESKSVHWWQSYLSGAANASIYPKTPMSIREKLSDSLTRKEFALPPLLPPGYSPAVLLRAAWAILMARHTGGEYVVFGETRLGRNVPVKGVERMPGPTIASAPILVQVDRENTIESLLQRVRNEGIQMQEFEHLGLQNISRVSEDARAACNFQTLLVFLEAEDRVDGDSIFEIDETIDDIRNFNSNYLLIYFSLTRKSLITQAVFREPAISGGQVDLLLQQLQSIFSRLCSLPKNTLIKQLDVASEHDLAQIWDWNAIPAETVDEYIHELIAKNALKNPDRLAVLAHDGELTYKELDDYSTNLAAQLIAKGIGLNCFVPLCFEKSVLVPIAMLAVIKTGAAFSVMDVSYPESRLKIITEALVSTLVMTSPSQLNLAKRLSDEVFIVDTISYTDTTELHRYQVIESSPRNTDRIMYVCFTSGSTGVPKGVKVSHRNLSSAAVAQTRELDFVPDDRVYDFSSHAFDANIWHFYLGFVVGACVCIPSHEDRMGNLAGSITSFKSTALFLTPSVARTINPQEVPTVKRLYLGGEAVTPLDVSMWKDSVELWGAYGPTETTPLCIFTRLFAPESASNIGRGVGVRSWVCDPNNHEQLVAVGAIGEMVNEGPLVTQGYHNQPEKTAAVFIESPNFLQQGFQDKHGRHGRLYKTGDLVRYCFDGTIQYLGRADTQVKLRGQRVEYGEIEYHLKRALPESSSICEVILHPSSGRPMLVAFCSLSSSSLSLDRAGARAYLSKRLPPYMIPEFFLRMTEIPKNPSGKVDRLKLRAVGPEILSTTNTLEGETDVERVYGPHTEMETLLGTLWSTALGHNITPIYSDTDFVDVGGDSIAAMKLSNLARKHDLSLTVKDIIQYPTLSSMALHIRSIQILSNSPKPFSLLDTSDIGQILANASVICNVPPEAYIKRSVFEVPSYINLEKLVQAWDTVYQYNTILRTRFVEVQGFGLLQVVVSGHHRRKYGSLESCIKAFSEHNPDLGNPLSHLSIIEDKTAPKIVWTVHHALYDEWSTLIIEEQLRRAYQGRAVTRPPDFSGYVRHILSQNQNEAKSFWKSQLSGCISTTTYPILPSTSYSVRPSKTFNRRIHPDVGSFAKLQARIHAAWALIVSKLTGSDDVVFAATLAGRNASVEGIEQMVGPTITPVPIRIQLERDQCQVQDLLSAIENNTAKMAAYQHIGLKNIELINDDTRAACKFQTLIVITPAPESGVSELDSIKTSTYETHSKEGEAFHTFALVLFFFPTKDGLDLQVVFDPTILDEREVERLAGRLESTISSLSNNTFVSDIECLGKEDLNAIWGWNNKIPSSNEQVLHELILESASKRPDKVAVDAWDCKLSYSQLDNLSRNLASHLSKYGVGRHSVIPILSPKSGYIPVAVLAILRSGAAFLPLDSTQPLNRLKTVVNQVKPDVILAATSTIDAATSLGAKVVPIETCRNAVVNGTNTAEQEAESHLDDVACILFTSGSTGIPKGVMQTHRALSSSVIHQAAQSGFTDTTRAFEFASYTFDVSWNMIFKILAVGGTLCVPSEEDRQNDLSGALSRSGATLTELTASVARLLNPDALSHLETLILSGEPVDIREFEHWKPKVRVIVCYGPSECTSVSTINPGLQDQSSEDGIGRASGCAIWIVDPKNYRHLMPVGAVGEILIQGPIVGKGYYNNETLTRASYISDLPWLNSTNEGKAIFSKHAFLSGDLARYDENGNLHFVSRKDLQVKLHGQRIELEEVQHHVRKVIGDVVGPVIACILGDSGPGSEQKLAAFLTEKHTERKDVCDLAVPESAAVTALQIIDEKLGALLPKYMVPSAYYFVTTVPLTNNGKINRKRLAELASIAQPDQIYRGRTSQEAARRKPSTVSEAKMQQLWSVALALPTEVIGADDNFFNLNGDSISAMRLVAGARSEGFDLRVSDVFANPRLSDLAPRLLSKAKQQQVAPSQIGPFELLGKSIDIPAIRSEAARRCGISNIDAVEDVYPCTPLQETMLAATIKDPSAFISMRVYRISQDIDLNKLRNAWATVVARHRILRTRLVDLDTHGLNQIVVQDAPLSWDHYDSMKSFLKGTRDVNMGPTLPLTRWALINSNPNHQLVWTIHHAMYDGWTLPIIENEVREAYFQRALEKPYLDMRPLVNYIRKEQKNASVSFWGRELTDAGESTVFPSLRYHNYEPRPATYLEKTISADISTSHGISLSALLYGSWSIVVSHATGNSKVSLGAILTGRNAPIDGIDRVIGPAVTTVPIFIDADSGLTVQDFMTRLHDTTVRRIPHEHLGIHAIRRINSTCEAACNFQTVLVIQPPRGSARSKVKDIDQVLEEIDETKIEGFPDQHSVLNQYGLMMEILPIDKKMTIRASFDSKLISGAEMDRMCSRWEQVIQEILQILNQGLPATIGTLNSISRQEIDAIWGWNKNEPEAVTDQLVLQTISEIATQTPETLAIDAWDGRLTYRELEELSSRLANYLVSLGVRPGQFVPLIFPKSMWANVSMLGVLKTGAAFVPLDADHPEGHLRAIMQPLTTDFILCAAQTRDRASRLARNAIMVDATLVSGEATKQYIGITSCFSLPSANDLAYAVFTSGSTGAAKGVKITHKNLATAIQYQAGPQGYQINPSTRSLDSSSYSFDACVCNFFYTITQGGCLCIPSEESLKGDIASFIRDYQINWAQLVPSVARTIHPDSLPDLKTLVLTGEPLTKGDIEKWHHRIRLVNAYGPTECTILCAISSQITDPSELGSIGRGRGANLWLTEIGNPNKLAPIGAPGEILIEGPIIGAGYLGPYKYPLVENPSWLLAGTESFPGRQGILFRTGDKARYAEDGTLVFIGRIGSEIKLRGQRVDLTAVEDAIRRRIPSGLEIAAEIVHVNLGEKSQERQMLLTFVSTAHGSLADCHQKLEENLRALVPDLKSGLDAVLPTYMQPEAFFPIPAILKTSSGKTDRRRLKEFGKTLRLQQLIWISGEMANTSSTPPCTEEERTLAALWAELLGVQYQSIFREDDFFKLGGDSLGVMRLTTKAHERGLGLKAAEVFKTPKLALLAQKITTVVDITKEVTTYKPYSLLTGDIDIKEFTSTYIAPVLNVDSTEIEDILPANGFQVDYMHNEEEPLGLQYAYLDIGPEVSWPKLVEACRTVVQAYQCLRARFVYHQGKYYQIILRDAPLLTEEIVSSEYITPFSNQFCPRDGRQAQINDIFTKMTLVNTENGQRRAILRMSHMQNDGWCTVRILKEVANVFNGGEVAKTPNWTNLLHYRRQTAHSSHQYWQTILNGSSQITPPLLYKPGGTKVRTLRSYALPYFHTSDDNRRTRPTVVINVAWALVLQHLAGHTDLTFGNVTTGRNGAMPSLDSVIGPCVNMLPFRLRLDSRSLASNRRQYLRDLVEVSAQQVDDRTSHEGLDWEEMVDRCTDWPSGTRYTSAVHFRNMAFEPELTFGNEHLMVTWYELVATPHWTTVLVYPENDVLRLWLLANPVEIGDDGADEILHMLAGYCDEIVASLHE